MLQHVYSLLLLTACACTVAAVFQSHYEYTFTVCVKIVLRMHLNFCNNISYKLVTLYLGVCVRHETCCDVSVNTTLLCVSET